MKANVLLKLILIGVVFFCEFSVFAQHSSPWNVPKSAKEKKNLFLADESSIVRGRKSYKMECLRCHGKKGKGDGSSALRLGKEVSDLTTDYVQNQTDGELFWKISEGRSPMPVNKRTLTNDQRWDVVNYIRTFKKK